MSEPLALTAQRGQGWGDPVNAAAVQGSASESRQIAVHSCKLRKCVRVSVDLHSQFPVSDKLAEVCGRGGPVTSLLFADVRAVLFSGMAVISLSLKFREQVDVMESILLGQRRPPFLQSVTNKVVPFRGKYVSL